MGTSTTVKITGKTAPWEQHTCAEGLSPMMDRLTYIIRGEYEARSPPRPRNEARKARLDQRAHITSHPFAPL